MRGSSGSRSPSEQALNRHTSILMQRKRLDSAKQAISPFFQINIGDCTSAILPGTGIASSQNGFAVEIAGERKGNEQPTEVR